MADEQFRLAAHPPPSKHYRIGKSISGLAPKELAGVFFGGFGGNPEPSANTAVVLAIKSNAAKMKRTVFIGFLLENFGS